VYLQVGKLSLSAFGTGILAYYRVFYNICDRYFIIIVKMLLGSEVFSGPWRCFDML